MYGVLIKAIEKLLPESDTRKLAKQMEVDFNSSYNIWVDAFIQHNLNSLNLPTSQLEILSNNYEFNQAYLDEFIVPAFSYGWYIGFLEKYMLTFPELRVLVKETEEEAKEHITMNANFINSYFQGYTEISHIYRICGNNMYYEGKDAGNDYKDIVIKRI